METEQIIDYPAKLTEGRLEPGGDVGEVTWVEPGNLPQIWDELHDDTRRVLQLAKLSGGNGELISSCS